MAQQTWTAKAVAAEASKVLGRNVRPSRVRGLARGDSGAPLIPRLADDAYTSHAYTAPERRLLLDVLTGKRQRPTKAPSTAKAPRKAAKAAKTAPKAVPTRNGGHAPVQTMAPMPVETVA